MVDPGSMQASTLVRRYVVAVEPNVSIAEASVLMARHSVGSLPVVDRTGTFVGLISESGVVRAVAEGRDLAETPVGHVMVRRAVAVDEDSPTKQAAQLMCANHARHLPVTRGGRLVGMISCWDVIREMKQEASLESSRVFSGASDTITGD